MATNVVVCACRNIAPW